MSESEWEWVAKQAHNAFAESIGGSEKIWERMSLPVRRAWVAAVNSVQGSVAEMERDFVDDTVTPGALPSRRLVQHYPFDKVSAKDADEHIHRLRVMIARLVVQCPDETLQKAGMETLNESGEVWPVKICGK